MHGWAKKQFILPSTNIYLYLYLSIYIHIYVYLYLPIYICICISIHLYVYVYIYKIVLLYIIHLLYFVFSFTSPCLWTATLWKHKLQSVVHPPCLILYYLMMISHCKAPPSAFLGVFCHLPILKDAYQEDRQLGRVHPSNTQGMMAHSGVCSAELNEPLLPILLFALMIIFLIVMGHHPRREEL